MKPLFPLKTPIEKAIVIVSLLSLVSLVYPEISLGASLETSGQNPALVFEVKNPTQNLESQNSSSITYQQILENDPKYKLVKNYLIANNSPLADYTDQLLQHDNWKTVLAISFVESNMCVHNFYHNCSGIGGQQYLRKYKDFGAWINDMSTLLDSRYNGWSIDKMNGVYVQPKSRNWAYGAKQVLSDLNALEQAANAQNLAGAPAETEPVTIASLNNVQLAFLNSK